MNEELEWNDGWPDWCDSGKKVQLQRDDGSIFEGTLNIDDFNYGGEGEKYTIWSVVKEDKTEESFAMADKWRFM